MRYFPCLFLLVICSCTTPATPQSKSIFGYYSHTDTTIIGYTGIQLNPDSTYYYGSGMCVGSMVDTGRFTLQGDTIELQSAIADKVDTSNHGFGEIRPLTGDKYLLKNNRIYFWKERGNYDTTAYWSLSH